MELRDYYLLAARTLCTALACASFFITPFPSNRRPILDEFLALKGSTFLAMFMGPIMLGSHVASLKTWIDPHEYFSYPFVFAEWALAAVHWGCATAAWGVITDPHYLPSCHMCQRRVLASGLALLMAALGVANAMVLLCARLTSNGQRLLAIWAGP